MVARIPEVRGIYSRRGCCREVNVLLLQDGCLDECYSSAVQLLYMYLKMVGCMELRAGGNHAVNLPLPQNGCMAAT
jgi:hypothetical protein